MKHIYNYLTFLLCLFTMTVYTGCKDDEEELVAKQFEIDGSELNKEIDFRSTTISIPVKTNMRVSEWSVNSNQKWVTAFQQKDEIILSVLDSKLTNERTAKVTVTSEVGVPPIPWPGWRLYNFLPKGISSAPSAGMAPGSIGKTPKPGWP